MDTNTPSIDAKALLAGVPEERSFRLNNGGSISSLRQLYSALQSMDDAVFRHHVTGERNDFGNWVKDVHKDYRLANSLFNSSDREGCARAVGGRLYELEKTVETEQKKVFALPAPKQEEVKPAPESEPVPKKAALPDIRPVKEEPEPPKPPKKAESFNKEEAIAKAILERKPIDHLIEPRKRKKAETPKPSEKSGKPKNEMETAAERLEKILSEAAKAKLESKPNKPEPVMPTKGPAPVAERPRPRIINEPYPKVEAPKTAKEEPLFEMPAVADDESTAEVIRLVEEKSFAGQIKSDMKSIFTASSMKHVASDMKKIVPSKKQGTKEEVSEVKEGPVAEKTAESVSDKDVILAHLKRVYTQ